MGKAKRRYTQEEREREEDLSEWAAVYIGALFAGFTARHYLLLLLRRQSHRRGSIHTGADLHFLLGCNKFMNIMS